LFEDVTELGVTVGPPVSGLWFSEPEAAADPNKVGAGAPRAGVDGCAIVGVMNS
jgi:hypothetical protein